MVNHISSWLLDHLGVAYLVIVFFTAIIYKTAFDFSLPFLKKILVYLLLAVGCLLLTFFHLLRFPIIPVLMITVLMIVITKMRLRYSEREEAK